VEVAMQNMPPKGTQVYVLKTGIDRVLVGEVLESWGPGKDPVWGHEGIVRADGYASLIGVRAGEVEIVAVPPRS
jgi:hypothetical protein